MSLETDGTRTGATSENAAVPSPGPAVQSDRPGRAERRPWPYALAGLVLTVGLLVTIALVVVSAILYHNNEKRLLALRARDASAILTASVPDIQTPLASAAALADATHGDRKKFMRFVAPLVSSRPSPTFVSVSLWRVTSLERGPLVVAGAPPRLIARPLVARFFLGSAARSRTLSLVSLASGPRPRLGFGFSGSNTRYVVYGETALPANRYEVPQQSSSFSDLNYAVYLGPRAVPSHLLVTSVRRLPLSGQTATVSVPFADTRLTLVVSARSPLAGSLPQRLPWAIGLIGLVLTLGATVLTRRLIDRRRQAEKLAGRLEEVAESNRRLYAEQRGIAQTLQHALLPDTLPQPPGLQALARYQAGVDGVDIGGDWYDLITLEDQRLLLVVGDVSGRGLTAATTMASLRFAIHAYVVQGDEPAAILPKLSSLVSVKESGQMATVLCTLVDVAARTATITSAGHLPPLLIGEGLAEFVRVPVGLPVGVDSATSYPSTTVTLPPRATLLAFTDGLVERRGESIDIGLERLRSAVSHGDVPLDALLNRITQQLREDQAHDDAALVGVRWLT